MSHFSGLRMCSNHLSDSWTDDTNSLSPRAVNALYEDKAPSSLFLMYCKNTRPGKNWGGAAHLLVSEMPYDAMEAGSSRG